jgi:hypothetical protein
MLNRCSYIVNADPTAEKIALLTQLLNQVCEHLEASGLVDRSIAYVHETGCERDKPQREHRKIGEDHREKHTAAITAS